MKLKQSDQKTQNYYKQFNDWSHMDLKKSLIYKKDFVVIKNKMYNYIRKNFGGGPSILLFTSRKFEMEKAQKEKLILKSDEENLKEDRAISLELMKIDITLQDKIKMKLLI